jgi:hypothetical protein
MRKLLVGVLVLVLLAVAFCQVSEAAKWKFHEWLSKGGHLTVYGTINCETVGPPLFEGDLSYCNGVSGWVPPWCNDFMTINWWKNYACQNKDSVKTAVKYYDIDRWRLYPLNEWLDSNLGQGVTVTFPTIGDSTGVVQNVHILVNLDEWLADPRPFQDEYSIVNGECPDLPGFLIGTTPMLFDSLAGPGEDPFSTTPYTGLLFRSGDMGYVGGVYVPAFSHWGLVALIAALAVTTVWLMARRRRSAASTA